MWHNRINEVWNQLPDPMKHELFELECYFRPAGILSNNTLAIASAGHGITGIIAEYLEAGGPIGKYAPPVPGGSFEQHQEQLMQCKTEYTLLEDDTESWKHSNYVLPKGRVFLCIDNYAAAGKERPNDAKYSYRLIKSPCDDYDSRLIERQLLAYWLVYLWQNTMHARRHEWEKKKQATLTAFLNHIVNFDLTQLGTGMSWLRTSHQQLAKWFLDNTALEPATKMERPKGFTVAILAALLTEYCGEQKVNTTMANKYSGMFDFNTDYLRQKLSNPETDASKIDPCRPYFLSVINTGNK